jgi:glycosyltransferase involved in cell wall biosynthesis
MKILLVVPYFWPALSFGGPAKVVYELSRELSARHTVTVFTSDAYNGTRRIKNSEKVKNTRNLSIYYFRNFFNSTALLYRLYTNFGIVFEYFRHKNEFEIIHINDIFSLPQIFLTYVARIYKKPYIVSSHGVDVSGRVRKSLAKSFMYKVFVKGMLQNAKCIIATSVGESDILKSLGYKNIKVIYNGLSDERVKPSTAFDKYKKADTFTLLYIGRINLLKGLELLVNSVKNLSFPFQLLIAGPDDGAKDILSRMIDKSSLRQKVHFLGFVNELEKEELYGISDIFVYPSKLEGFSIGILEAMQHSLPVLITEACNFPEVRTFNAGIILPNDMTPLDISKTLRSLNMNREKLKSMGKMPEIWYLENTQLRQ